MDRWTDIMDHEVGYEDCIFMVLKCAARQIATCPMEGFTAWGIRKALKIPRRYTIPLIVATRSPYRRDNKTAPYLWTTEQ
eukprot:scaffold3977_cov96-Cylindrotheca_fusiformis.AAC.4